MKSRYLTNVLLILVIAGLYWFNSQSDTSGNVEQTISNISANSIQKIIIDRSYLDDIVLEKKSDDWLLLEPFKAKANSTRIKLLLSLLASPSYAQLAHSDNKTLTQLGLSPAKTTLKLNEHHFQFGDVETISNRRYVLFNDTVHLLDDQISHLLNANASSFIDNRLIQPGNNIVKISLPILSTDNTFIGQNIIIENSDGQWTSEQEHYTTDQLTALLSVWQHAYALQVLPIENQQDTLLYKTTLWYENIDQPSELEIELTDKALFIYDLEQQLKYQFPIALAGQLFPSEIATP